MNSLIDIIEFKGRNHSGSTTLNYLSNHENIYIMDNHKMALWCWLQKIDTNCSYNVLHIDRHTDALHTNMPLWLSAIGSVEFLKGLTALEYSELKWEAGINKDYVFLWGNYLSIFIELFSDCISVLQMVTNEERDVPDFSETIFTVSPVDFIKNIDNILSSKQDKWIINIDVDYFVVESGNGYLNLFSDDFIDYLTECLYKLSKEGFVEIMTISLSPECAGGWENSIQLANKICKKFGCNISEI